MIKNWKSQRWQTLLNFNSKRRLLITGTPLQNDLMELWSLMHFLMPHVFSSHEQFRQWFSNPLTGMVEGASDINKALVDRLHGVLRPFLLRCGPRAPGMGVPLSGIASTDPIVGCPRRRLKSEVEKQLPGKHEHVLFCNLSKRQRTLYEDYMASSDTRSALSSGNFLGMANVLMQLRKASSAPKPAPCLPWRPQFEVRTGGVFLRHAIAGLQPPGPFRGPPDHLGVRPAGQDLDQDAVPRRQRHQEASPLSGTALSHQTRTRLGFLARRQYPAGGRKSSLPSNFWRAGSYSRCLAASRAAWRVASSSRGPRWRWLRP